MSTMGTLAFTDSNSDGWLDKNRKGWFVSWKIALLLLIVVSAALVVVGVAVHYLSPDRGHYTPEAQYATPNQPVSNTVSTMSPTPSNIRLRQNLSGIHYRLKLRPDFYDDNDTADYSFYGEVNIQFRCLEVMTSIVLHANQLVIDSQRLKGSTGNEVKVKRLTEDKDLQWLNFTLDEALVPGSDYQLQVNFSGPLKNDMEGIYWSSYLENNITKRLVTSQMEPTKARKVFPCFDEPDIKATFDVIIVRKRTMTSLSNTNIINTINSTDLGDEWVEDHFARTPVPMSTYLLAFTVCSGFEFVENVTSSGKPFRVYARKAVKESAKYALDIGIKIQDFFERHFNISFPFPKQDMLAVPEFGAGAMENWGLIIYRETALLYDPNSSSTANKMRVATVISHELAHQWFGNLVTLSWWDDTWLNEGFASYFEYVGLDHAEPTWNFMDHFLPDDLHSVLSVDSLSTSHPIHYAIQSTDDISSVFDSITYSKGAAVIRMMQNVLGEKTFISGLTRYLNRHRYSNANHKQLWTALSEQSRLDGGTMDVSRQMDPWIKQTGYPVVTVHVSRDNGQNATKVSISQTRFIRDQGSNSNTELLWPIPFTYVLSTNANWLNATIIWINSKQETVMLSDDVAGTVEWNGPSDSWVIGNIGQNGYYRVNYNANNWMSLIRQLKTNHTVIPVKNRAQIIDDAFEIGRAGLVDQLIGMQMTEYLDREREYVVWTTAVNSISYVSTMLDRSPGYGHLEGYILKKLKPVYEVVRWEVNSHETADYRLLRSTLLQQSCFYGHRPCITKATELYREWMESNKRVAGDLKQTVYCNGIREGGRAEWDFAFEKYSSSEMADEKSRLIYALSCSKTPWILRRYLTYIWERMRKQDAPHAFSYIARNPVGRELAWNFFRSHWKEIIDRYGRGVFLLSHMIKTATEAFNTDTELKQLRDFWNSSSSNMGVGVSTYEQAIERTRLNILWMDKNEMKISDWLKENS